jgi:hypothetical protein
MGRGTAAEVYRARAREVRTAQRIERRPRHDRCGSCRDDETNVSVVSILRPRLCPSARPAATRQAPSTSDARDVCVLDEGDCAAWTVYRILTGIATRGARSTKNGAELERQRERRGEAQRTMAQMWGTKDDATRGALRRRGDTDNTEGPQATCASAGCTCFGAEGMSEASIRVHRTA